MRRCDLRGSLLPIEPGGDDVAVAGERRAGRLTEAAQAFPLERQDAVAKLAIRRDAGLEVPPVGDEATLAVMGLALAVGAGGADGVGVAEVAVESFASPTDVHVVRLGDVDD